MNNTHNNLSIGVYGGSFNPIHVGHLTVAQQAKKKLNLDKVLFIPAGRPYFKNPTDILPYACREQMVRQSIKNVPYFEVCDIEKDETRPSYTADTLAVLSEMYKGSQLYLILGMDAAVQFDDWHDAERIPSLAKIAVFERNKGQFVADHKPDGVLTFDCDVGVSSSYIREQIKTGGSFRFIVPRPVYERVIADKLYGYGGDEHGEY